MSSKGKGRPQSGTSSHATTFSAVSSVSSVSSSPTTRSAVRGEQSILPSTPTPSHAGASGSYPRSYPATSASAHASRSAQSSAGVPIRRSATLGLRTQPTSNVGSHTRAVITTYGYPSSTVAIVASVQSEYTPEAWPHALSRRVDGCSQEFVAALVRAMHSDLGLSQSQE